MVVFVQSAFLIINKKDINYDTNCQYLIVGILFMGFRLLNMHGLDKFNIKINRG